MRMAAKACANVRNRTDRTRKQAGSDSEDVCRPGQGGWTLPYYDRELVKGFKEDSFHRSSHHDLTAASGFVPVLYM